MKKNIVLTCLVLSITSLTLLVNCAIGESVNKKETCGNSVEVKKYECNQGTCYYVVTSPNISFDYVVKATLKAKANANPAVEDITVTLNPSELSPSIATADGGLFLLAMWSQRFGYNTETPQRKFTEGVIYTSYNVAHYEYPSFEIELIGECPDETKIISAEDVEEEAVTFEPSTLATAEIEAGDDLEVYLFSNNPKVSIPVTITTSLGETESKSLSRILSSNFYEGTLQSILSNTKGADNDGSINVQNGTTVTITYNDALDENDNTVSISATITVIGDLAPTCTDGIQNGDEEDVDCGGSNCTACPTCSDGIQNGDETDIDCGGTNCDACATCEDGIQNGDETGIDCGGSNCEACAVGGLTFEGVTYEITYASYLDYTANGKSYILFTISRFENELQVFSADIEIVSSTTISTGTYTFGDVDFGVTGNVAVDNVPDYATITGGFVVLVITPTGDYALELDLMTDKGALTGSHTVPGS